ncbi:MAG: DUF2877 domain-containing protein [Armatimonadetes bacterium]|nr:DUF2877 domain-containing protein [Armatimonadota bacterium]
MNGPGPSRSPVRLAARAISVAVADTVCAPLAGCVLAAFARSCYLDANGIILAVVAPALEEGPFSIVLREETAPFGDLDAGEQIVGDGRRLRLGGAVEIDLTRAAAWDPRLSPVAVPREAAEAVARRLMARAPEESIAALLPEILGRAGTLPAARPDPAEARGIATRAPEAEPPHFAAAREGMTRALAAVRAGRKEDLAAAARRLTGLGPGLTPAGDDFLAGLLLGLHAARVESSARWRAAARKPAAMARELAAAEAGAAITAAVEGRTTRISLAYLAAAAGGLASAPWHRLVKALAGHPRASTISARTERNEAPEAVADAVDRVLRVGETSGADMLAGFVATLLAV